MPSSTIVASGGRYRLYDDSVQTFSRLPVATYAIEFSKMAGYSLREVAPLAPGEETVYGSHRERVDRIVGGYADMDRSLGVILSGDKGMGKSLLIRMLAHRVRTHLGLPTILVQQATPDLTSFLDSLGEVLVVFDEFEKVFPSNGDSEAQSQFLPLFDGLSAVKRLYAVSVNDLSRVNEFMLNRPGRFHYHMRFEYPGPETVATYLRAQVPEVEDKQVAEIVEFSRKYNLNFDHLRAISFELRRGALFADVIGDLNIKRPLRHDTFVEAYITWDDGQDTILAEPIDLFDPDGLQEFDSYGEDLTIRFRMRDAVPSRDGYRLPPGTYEVLDTRPPHPRAVTSVELRRMRQPRVDF